ncbi:unnamed protein product [Commensalibacter communis]|uniref:hypothetical protein n=1 Tax=Commensalibacter communis TaxID=2972786 RepID=UPI0022FFB8B8|nr:hypothetical protein [Commensalibacter communis]CAI3959818.1 unnamed protein product [Commensalibacter communis]CAI3959889.1 unnamed protein product [Commensalibacter communis]
MKGRVTMYRGDLYARINFLSEGILEHFDGPSLKQSQAYDKLFKIWAAMDKYHCMILSVIVLGNITSKEISQKL